MIAGVPRSSWGLACARFIIAWAKQERRAVWAPRKSRWLPPSTAARLTIRSTTRIRPSNRNRRRRGINWGYERTESVFSDLFPGVRGWIIARKRAGKTKRQHQRRRRFRQPVAHRSRQIYRGKRGDVRTLPHRAR